jgi:hypothetical protein
LLHTTGTNLRKLAVALGVTMDALVGLEDRDDQTPLTVAQLLGQLDAYDEGDA